MARIRTKPRQKPGRPQGALIGCVVLVLLGIALVTWMFSVALNPD